MFHCKFKRRRDQISFANKNVIQIRWDLKNPITFLVIRPSVLRPRTRSRLRRVNTLVGDTSTFGHHLLDPRTKFKVQSETGGKLDPLKEGTFHYSVIQQKLCTRCNLQSSGVRKDDPKEVQLIFPKLFRLSCTKDRCYQRRTYNDIF